MADPRIPRRSKRLGLRRAAAPAAEPVEVPRGLMKAVGKAMDKAIAAPKEQAKPPKPATSSALPPLNVKQKLFVQHYLINRNATEAAKKAGYSAKTAHSCGPRLLVHAGIAAAISKKTEKVMEKLEISRERIQMELARVGLSSMKNYVRIDADGAPITDFSDLSDDEFAALTEITVEEFKDGRSDKREVRRVKFKLGDKIAALTALGKDLGMFTETHKHEHTHTLVGTLLDEIDDSSRSGLIIEHQAQEKSGG